MGRSPCCDESGLKKGPWTSEEDDILVKYIQNHGHGSWRALPKNAGLNRCGKSCRLRWTNYLRPDIKRGKFSPEEEQTILNLHGVLGNKWSAIASHLPGRTDNEIKNFWNTHLKKKLIQMGFDPMTHRPRSDLFSSLPQLLALANLKELLDHQSLEDHAVRLQAEAIAKVQYLQLLLQTPSSNYDLSVLTASSPINNNNNKLNNFADVETLKLLSSLAQSESSIPSSIGSGSSLGHDNFPFAELQKSNPCNFQITSTLNKDNNTMCHVQEPVLSQEENSSRNNSMWQLPPLYSTDALVTNQSLEEVRSDSIDWPDFNDLDQDTFLSGIDGLMS